MLKGITHRVGGLLDWVYLRAAKNDPLRADELRTEWTGKWLKIVLAGFPVLAVIVAVLFIIVASRGEDSDEERKAVEAYSMRYLNTYLKDPNNPAAVRQFYCGDDFPAVAIPAGGRAVAVNSALPGKTSSTKAGVFRTWSVIVDTEIPKAANSTSTFYVPMRILVSVDPNNLLCGVTLPGPSTERKSGTPVQLASTIEITSDRPLYSTVQNFLTASLTGKGDLAPYVAEGSRFRRPESPRFLDVTITSVRASSDLASGQNVPAKADGIEVSVRGYAQLASGVNLPIDELLVLSVAAGHWQVEQLNDAPNVLAPSDSSPSTTATTTSTSPTTTRITAPPPVGKSASTTTTLTQTVAEVPTSETTSVTPVTTTPEGKP